MAYVYRHIRLDTNQPFYIGIGRDEENYRRANDFIARSEFWLRTYEKCNKQIEVEILFDDLTWDEACVKEKEFIALYGRKDISTGILTNMTNGGEGTENLNDEIRKIIGQKVSQKLTGSKRTKEQCENISKSKMGHKVSDETKLKLSKKIKGSKRPLELVQQISNTLRNKYKETPFVGHSQDEETRNKISKTMKGVKKNYKVNSVKGLVWIHNDSLQKNKMVSPSIVESFINDGWIKGSKKFS